MCERAPRTILSMSASPPPSLSGRSFLLDNAHDALTIAEAEIKRLSTIIQSIPARDATAHRLLTTVAERLRHGGESHLTDDEVDEIRAWYFEEQRAIGAAPR
jgi:hypothetical protein